MTTAIIRKLCVVSSPALLGLVVAGLVLAAGPQPTGQALLAGSGVSLLLLAAGSLAISLVQGGDMPAALGGAFFSFAVRIGGAGLAIPLLVDHLESSSFVAALIVTLIAGLMIEQFSWLRLLRQESARG
jgi:hypothetical protein